LAMFHLMSWIPSIESLSTPHLFSIEITRFVDTLADKPHGC
jgi:hypothetical protein